MNAAPTPLHQGSCANAWGPSPFLTLAHPVAQRSPTEKDLLLHLERGMDSSGLQSHPFSASRQGAPSTQSPPDPSGRVNCLRTGEQRERERCGEKTSRAERKHAAHPSPTTYDQTDSRDRLAAPSSPVQPPGTSPTARRSPCRPPALGSSHLAQGRAPQRGSAVLAVVAVTTFPFLHSTPWSCLSWEWGSCSLARPPKSA